VPRQAVKVWGQTHLATAQEKLLVSNYPIRCCKSSVTSSRIRASRAAVALGECFGQWMKQAVVLTRQDSPKACERGDSPKSRHVTRVTAEEKRSFSEPPPEKGLDLVTNRKGAI